MRNSEIQPTRQRLGVLAATMLMAAGLAGCGGSDGLELNGKVFDWLGVSESSASAARNDRKLADRPPLVMPPDQRALPVPGSGQDGVDPMLAALDDPDARKIRTAAERQALHQSYCRGDRNWKENAFRTDNGTNRSPFGPCNSLVGDALQPANTGTQTK